MSPGATRRIVTGSARGTEAVGEEMSRGLSPGSVLLLTGDLGAGKTTLVRGLARGLGIAVPVRSPSFTILTGYRGVLPLTHVDLYRVRTEAEARGAGIPDLFDPDGVTAVEWAERLPEPAIRGAIEVEIRITGDEEREITLRGPEEVLARLGATLA